MIILARLTSMKSSLPAPRRSASTSDVSRTLTAAKENFKKGAQARPPLQSRKNVIPNWPEKPLNRLRKSTIDTNNLKPVENQLPRSSVSKVKSRRFTIGSFNPNSIRKLDRKMEPKFKKAAQTEGSPLNATFCLPCSDGKPARTKSSDVVMVQNCLPGTDATCRGPESKLVPSANLPLTPVEPGDFTSLLTTPIMQECLEIAAQLSDEGKTCPVDALCSQCPMINVSVITEEPMPLDCSSSFYSDISLVKSPRGGCTLELPGNSLRDPSCQQIDTEINCIELPSSDTLENGYSDCDSETVSFSGNLIQFDTEVQSDPKDLVGIGPCVPEAEGHSKNVNQSPAVNSCQSSEGVEDLMTLDGTMVHNDASGMLSKNEFPDESAMQTKPSSTSTLPLSKADLLLCEGPVVSDEILVVPQQNVCFGNEVEKPATLTNFPQSLTPGNLIQLNKTMTLKGNRTFDTSKTECSFGNDSNRLPSTGNKVQLNDTITMDHKNTTFEASKHECKLGSDPNVTGMLLPIIGDKVQLNDTMTMDHKNATFEASRHECNLGSNSNEAAGILPPTIDNQMQLINTMNVDQRDATFETLKHEESFGGDVSKVTTLSHCTNEGVQLNGTTPDLKDARFEPTEVGNNLEMVEDGRGKELPSCEPLLSSEGLNDLEQLNSKSLTLVRKHEGSALISFSEQQGIKQNGESSHSKDSNAPPNFGKDDSKSSARSELHQGSGNISSAELEKGPPDLIRSIHLRDSIQNEEFNVCESADLVHDAVSSEWAPHFMSTPNVAMRVSFLEYMPFDHSFQSSSSTLQDDAHSALADYLDKQVPKADLSSGSIKSDTSCTGGRAINAPRIQQKAEVLMASSSKPTSFLPATRRKALSLAAGSREDKCSVEKKSIPLPRKATRLSSSSMGRGGKPPIQPSTLSKMCPPKPRLILGRPSSIGTGQSEASNQLASGRTGADTKMLAKAESQVTSRIPGIKRRSPRVASKDPAQELERAGSKPVQLFTMGVSDPPRSNRSAHRPSALPSKSIVTGVKRPGSAVGPKRQCPSPKRPKAVGEVTAKVPKKGAAKLLPLTESKQKEVKGVEKPASESKVNTNKSSTVESESSQQQDVAKLQRRIKELEEKIIALELENAALRQKEGLTKGLEEHCNV